MNVKLLIWGIKDGMWLKICVLKTTRIIILFSVTTKQIVNDVSDACLLVVRSFIYHSLKCW